MGLCRWMPSGSGIRPKAFMYGVTTCMRPRTGRPLDNGYLELKHPKQRFTAGDVEWLAGSIRRKPRRACLPMSNSGSIIVAATVSGHCLNSPLASSLIHRPSFTVHHSPSKSFPSRSAANSTAPSRWPTRGAGLALSSSSCRSGTSRGSSRSRATGRRRGGTSRPRGWAWARGTGRATGRVSETSQGRNEGSGSPRKGGEPGVKGAGVGAWFCLRAAW